jgi:hypothetical protein
MNDWEVTVITDSNYIKKVQVSDCFTREDAEAQALGSTGAKKVIVSNPVRSSNYKKTVQTEKVDNYPNTTYNNDCDDESSPEVLFLLIVFFICSILWIASPVISCIVGALSIWFVVWCNK